MLDPLHTASSAAAFRVVVVPGDPGVVLQVHGDLDLASRDALRRCADAEIARGVAHLVMDLGGLGFIDSSGLGVLIDLHVEAQEAGHTVSIRHLPPRLAGLLEVTGLTARIPLAPS